MSDKTAIPVDTDQKWDGIAAEDLPSDSITLKITLPEVTPHAATGTVGAGITSGNITIADRDGKMISSALTTANHVVATWEGKPNKRYPGLVRKGEPVTVYRKPGQDKYYWEESSRGRPYRTTDRHVLEVAASDPSKPGVDKDDTNSYTAGVDSDGKKVFVKTSKANGEPCAWSFEIDTDAGTVHISDDTTSPGNRIFMDSGAKSGTPVIHINISSGVTARLEGDNAFIKVPKMLQLSAEDRIIFDTPLMIFNTSKKGTVIINAANIAINAAASFVVSAVTAGINATSSKIGGVLVAASARIATLVKGSAGSSYAAPTINDPSVSPVVSPSNSPDTSMSGPPYQS